MGRIADKFEPRLFLYRKGTRPDLAVEFARYLCGGGSVFHIIAHTPDQCDDLYIILVDGKFVVRFEIAITGTPRRCTNAQFKSVSEYRKMIGQGKTRIVLDRAVKESKRILAELITERRFS